MPRFRADFELTCDLVLPHDIPPVSIVAPTFSITFGNEPKDQEGNCPSMSAQVVAECATIEEAEDHHREVLTRALDVLAFATHSRFRITECRRVVDWEPYMKTRRFRMGKAFDPRYPPDPEMGAQYCRTVEVILQGKPDRYVLEALRLFRLGLLDAQQQDQFQRFWLALEVIAEGRKGSTRRAIPCPMCSHGLECSQCRMSPLRRPMARQAIRALLADLLGEKGARAAYTDLIKIRDGLMHGRSPKSVERELTAGFDKVLDALARISWNAIMASMPKRVHNTEISIGHRDWEFASKMLRLNPIGTFDSDPLLEYPPEDRILSMKIEVKTSFTPTSAEK